MKPIRGYAVYDAGEKRVEWVDVHHYPNVNNPRLSIIEVEIRPIPRRTRRK